MASCRRCTSTVPGCKYAKFSPPVVANGKVYVSTFDQKIMVYGLK